MTTLCGRYGDTAGHRADVTPIYTDLRRSRGRADRLHRRRADVPRSCLDLAPNVARAGRRQRPPKVHHWHDRRAWPANGGPLAMSRAANLPRADLWQCLGPAELPKVDPWRSLIARVRQGLTFGEWMASRILRDRQWRTFGESAPRSAQRPVGCAPKLHSWRPGERLWPPIVHLWRARSAVALPQVHSWRTGAPQGRGEAVAVPIALSIMWCSGARPCANRPSAELPRARTAARNVPAWTDPNRSRIAPAWTEPNRSAETEPLRRDQAAPLRPNRPAQTELPRPDRTAPLIAAARHIAALGMRGSMRCLGISALSGPGLGRQRGACVQYSGRGIRPALVAEPDISDLVIKTSTN